MTDGGGALGRRGASLPVVILFMSLLALAVTVGLARVGDERRIVGDQQANVDAFSVAQSGLERYVALLDSAPGLTDSASIPIGTRDTAYVRLWRIRPPLDGRGLYVIRSRGVSHSARRFDAITPPAQRVIAQYAVLESPVDIDAAWTAIAGLRSLGNSGFISGIDECGSSADVAGVAVPDRLYTPPAQFNTGFGAPPNPVGSPPILLLGGAGSYPDDARTFVNIAWDSIVNGSVLQPDFTPASPASWPVPSLDWRVIRVNGDIELGASESGRGLIVVTDSLLLRGGFVWEGLILVGRQLAIEGNSPAPARVRGAMISGLDTKLLSPPFFSESNSGSSGSDQIDVQYNSCNVRQALTRYARLTLIANAWTDVWPQN